MTRAWTIAGRLADGRLHAPAAERNQGPIAAVLDRVLPDRGVVLEIASGTGQHVVHFAQAMPRLEWLPSDPDAAHRASISRWVASSAVANVRAPIALDVHDRPWPLARADALVCINMVHVAPWSATCALLDGARAVLTAGAVLFLYGPFARAGTHTAPSNAAFDASLRAHDARWGVRDIDDVCAAALRAGFALDEIVEMPANNLAALFRRAGATP